ncbi:hypothetical protein ACF1BU_34770 [Streptomyces sp. NPDC014724]|uniref:hypothetical protein n=1 Tax=unclassified Streptomyces TaxID=2593676 RepID=UPI0036FDBD6E
MTVSGLWPAGLSDVGVEEIEEVELDAAVDLDGWRVDDVADSQGEFAEVVEDHPAGGADAAVVRIEAGHGLVGAECSSDLPLDEAEDEQGRADDLDRRGDAPVVLHEDRCDRQGAFEVVVSAFDGALALVVDQYLVRAGLLGREAGDERVPAVDGCFGLEYLLVEVPGQAGGAVLVGGDLPAQAGGDAAVWP